MLDIRLVSDLHMEHCDFFVPPMVGDEGTVLLLPGDIISSYFLESEMAIRFFKGVSKQFLEVIYVPGNHEYYGCDLLTTDAKITSFLKEHALDNVHFLNPSVFEKGDVVFLGAALWTDFNRNSAQDMKKAQESINDYKSIRINGERLIEPKDVFEIHQEHLQKLKAWIIHYKGLGKKVVVLSHHAPSEMSQHYKYSGMENNSTYFSDLNAMIVELEPDVWVHGHCHHSLDYVLGKTAVFCNPRGNAEIQDLDAYLDWRNCPDIVDLKKPDASRYFMGSFKSLFKIENKNFNPYFKFTV